ncbi:Fatty acid hydroxylase superfamily protein [compost metagenome]
MHYTWGSWLDSILEISPISLLGIAVVVLIEIVVQGADNSLNVLRKSKARNFDLLGWSVFLMRFNPIFYDFILLGTFIKLKGPIEANSLELFSSVTEWPFAVRLIVSFLIYDFFQYVAHRLKHKISWLWIGHRWHHSTTELNAFSHMRGHTLDYIVRTLCIAFPVIFILGVSFENIFWLWVAEDISQGLAHSRINTNYGFLGKVFCSPRYHRRHHSIDDPLCNYGLVFSFWDRIFGTYKDESQSFAMATGTHFSPAYESQGAIKAYLNEFKNFVFYPVQRILDLVCSLKNHTR